MFKLRTAGPQVGEEVPEVETTTITPITIRNDHVLAIALSPKPPGRIIPKLPGYITSRDSKVGTHHTGSPGVACALCIQF